MENKTYEFNIQIQNKTNEVDMLGELVYDAINYEGLVIAENEIEAELKVKRNYNGSRKFVAIKSYDKSKYTKEELQEIIIIN